MDLIQIIQPSSAQSGKWYRNGSKGANKKYPAEF